jgi:putative endonuclease
MNNRLYCVYIITNKNNKVLYIGVTYDLQRRVLEHKPRKVSRFTLKYNITKLVYFESGVDINVAIDREK